MSSDHAVFSWVYMNYKSFLDDETDNILMAKKRIFFERLMQEFYTLFDYTSQ